MVSFSTFLGACNFFPIDPPIGLDYNKIRLYKPLFWVYQNSNNEWFFSREGESDIFYYSYVSHLDELIAVLKADGNEENLILAFEDKYGDITKQMAITEELTSSSRGYLRTSLFTFNFFRSLCPYS